MILTLGCSTAYPSEFMGECPLFWIGLRFGTLLSLIALVPGLLTLDERRSTSVHKV